jgi:hypothetical protein
MNRKCAAVREDGRTPRLFVPFSPFSALEMLNNYIFDIFLNDLFGIFK